MTDHPFWNPKTELMPRAELAELQLAKLRRVLTWAKARSPHYARTLAGVDPERIRTRALVETLGREDLPPCVAANLRTALAPVAVAVTDLGLRFEHLTDLHV